MSKATKTKNPCVVCCQQVKNKDGIQCQGACKKWAHFKCLGFGPKRIDCIKKGIEEVTCACPGCEASRRKGKENKSSPPTEGPRPPKPTASPPSIECSCDELSDSPCCKKNKKSKFKKITQKLSGCTDDSSSSSSQCSDDCPSVVVETRSEETQCPCPSPRQSSKGPTEGPRPIPLGDFLVSDKKYQKIKGKLNCLCKAVQELMCEIQEIEHQKAQ